MYTEKPNYTIRPMLVACFVAGVIEVLTLGSLRLSGHLSGQRYSWFFILSWPILAVVFVPGSFWLMQQLWATKWFERLGILILFFIIPLISVIGIVTMFMGHR